MQKNMTSNMENYSGKSPSLTCIVYIFVFSTAAYINQQQPCSFEKNN